MCMARTHVLVSGTIATLAAQPLSFLLADRPMSVPEMAAFAAVTAGYGLLPDIDHPSATMARVLGPVTRALAGVVGALAGGHRKGTHTVWFALLVIVGLGLLLPLWGPTAAVTLFVGLFFTAMVLRLGPRPRTGPAELSYALVAAAGTAAILFLLPEAWWIPWAVGLGVVAHLLADGLTVELISPAWPVSKVRVGLPILGRTGSAREDAFAWVLVPVWLVSFAVVAYLYGTWPEVAVPSFAGILG